MQAVERMINYNMHCHLLSSCCLLVIVIAALHRSISSCKSLPTTSNLYFRWSRWYYPLFKVKHWGSKRSSTYAKIIESLNLNPVIPVSKTHIPFTVLVTSLHGSWNRKAPLPGECYTQEQGWFVFVRLCLSFSLLLQAFNKYLLTVILLASSLQGPKDKTVSQNFEKFMWAFGEPSLFSAHWL